MIFRPELRAALGGLILIVTGCAEEGRPAEPIAAANDAVPAPDSAAHWVAAARQQYREGAHLAALESADRALARDSRDGSAILLRAQLVRDAQGFAASLPWFEAATRAAPDDREAWAEYAAALGDSGHAVAMLAAARKLAAVAPDDPRSFYLQAVLAARAGDPALARSMLTRSGLAERGVPAAMQLDAVIALEEGNPGHAVATLDALAKRQPANARVRELLARALWQGARAAELVERFGAEAERDDASPYLQLLVARAHERLGDRAKAAPLLARAFGEARQEPVVLGVRPGLPQPTAALRLAIGKGEAAQAVTGARALREWFPLSADFASLAGDAALGAGARGDALADYALAARVKRPWPLTRKAVFAYRANGDDKAADTLLARQVAGEPSGATGLFELARRLAARGDWARTALLLDHAIALGGGHDPAVLALRVEAARAMGQTEEVKRYASLAAEVRPRPLVP
jgi:Tfp pilus assembly protein PilF